MLLPHLVSKLPVSRTTPIMTASTKALRRLRMKIVFFFCNRHPVIHKSYTDMDRIRWGKNVTYVAIKQSRAYMPKSLAKKLWQRKY